MTPVGTFRSCRDGFFCPKGWGKLESLSKIINVS